MSTNGKIKPTHLDRKAYVYVRQSTPTQVQHNRESTRRQYKLVERAVELGWPKERVNVVDEDLARSGAGDVQRHRIGGGAGIADGEARWDGELRLVRAEGLEAGAHRLSVRLPGAATLFSEVITIAPDEDLYNALKAGEEEGFMLKSMNCPHHIEIYKSDMHSYRDLPLRIAEFGTVYRYEQSGEVSGMTRVRGFTQDDAHIFVAPEQLEDELALTVFAGADGRGACLSAAFW